MKNKLTFDYKITKSDKFFFNNHKSIVVWFFGLSGSGKSTLADLLEQDLHKNKIRRRQDRKSIFIEASTLWATKYDSLKKNNSIIGKTPMPFFVDQIESVDINEKSDLKLAKLILKNSKI